MSDFDSNHEPGSDEEPTVFEKLIVSVSLVALWPILFLANQEAPIRGRWVALGALAVAFIVAIIWWALPLGIVWIVVGLLAVSGALRGDSPAD